MTARRIKKILLKSIAIFFGVLVVLLTVFHFWFKAHAKDIIEDLVASKSKGKLNLKIEKLHFSYFSNKIEIQKAVFYTTDTISANTAYRFSVDKIKLQAKAILPIVFKNQLFIDSLSLLRPHIQVIRLRPRENDSLTLKKDVSIPEEIGKVYKSIQEALVVLNVKRFQFNDGSFTLVNKIIPDQIPLKITNLDFHIDNLNVDSAKLTGNEKLMFSDNIVLKSYNQNILFADGRHSLSFSKFRINLKKRVVEFDSCTIAATRGDSSSTSFSVFFDSLFLTNINFDTLYKTELIKADSVYCVNPKFKLDVQLNKKKGSNKPPPKLDEIIKQLTGDVQLGFVVVNNADFNIKTVKEGKPNSFVFSNNNFEMQGLSVDKESKKPLKIKSFVMAIRNYENFIKDSSYSIKFDSILFKDDRITLSNFLFNKLAEGKIRNTFSMPQFSLYGLSWDDLVFERKIKAEQAIMFSPNIDYTASDRKLKKADRRNIFQSLSTVNDFMDLKYLEIVDGRIDMKMKKTLRVQLENANISVQSNSLLSSTKLSAIKNSLTNLSFKKGNILVGNLKMELKDIRYIGKDGKFGAGSIIVNNNEKNMAITLQNVAVEKMQVNEITGSVYADGVKWQKGDIKLNSGVRKDESIDVSVIDLKNVQGANTSINAVIEGKTISTHLESIFFTALLKNPESKLKLEGLAVKGNQLQVKDNNLSMSVSAYDITDNSNSNFQQIKYKSNSGKMEADFSIPTLTLTPHIQPLINGEIALDSVNMMEPVINLRLAAKNNTTVAKKVALPKTDISNLKLTRPVINFIHVNDSSTFSLTWHGERNEANFLQGNEIHTSSGITSINSLNFYLTDFVFMNSKGKALNTGEGKISAQLKNIGIEQKDNNPLEWNANIYNFDALDFRFDSIGKLKGNLFVKSGTLNNLNISSSTIKNLQKTAAANSSFLLKQLTGYYTDANRNIRMYNAGFNRTSNTFSLDSFSFNHTLGKDSFIAKQTFQKDYINFKSGALSIGPVDIDNYIKNKKLNIGIAKVDKFQFTDFKDKHLPFNSGIIKPLPVNLIKKIPLLLSVDTVQFTNANVEYTELNEKTNKQGIIPVNRMTIRLINFKNYNIKPTDSLSIQANGYLMDTAWIRLRVKESYSDTLGGFKMTFRMKPADIRVLNPVLIPLTSVKLESGFLDTVSLRAVGREYLSLGEIQLYYHDLKVRFLENGDETKKTFRTGLITFFANTFLIKNKNTSRKGSVFYIRNREKSAINYLIKIALSGISSSVGAKSNKKIIRKYKNELQKHNLPPIDFE